MELSKKSKIAIINGMLFYKNKFVKGNLLINNKKIKKVILENISLKEIEDYTIIDAKNCYVSYGFFDPHVHFRCPGNEYKEDWHTGTRAAIKGGYTFVIDMPNNNPSAVDVKSLENKNNIAKKTCINYMVPLYSLKALFINLLCFRYFKNTEESDPKYLDKEG